MSDAVLDNFVPRDAELAEIYEAQNAVRADERDRRIRKLFTTVLPWAFGGCMTVVAAGAMAVMWQRPVVHDRLAVAMLNNGIQYEAPTLREDLPASRKAVLFNYSVDKFIKAREDYTYESINNNRRIVLAMSAPDEATRYDEMLHDEHSPENPMVKYGTGAGAGTATVEAVKVLPHPNSPNSVEAMFILRIQMPKQAAIFVRKFARMSFMEAPDKIDMGVQQVYDPAAIAFLNYASRDLEPTQ